MLSHGRLLATRMVAGFFLLAHLLGFLFFPIDLASFSTVYTAFVVLALSVFCFLPRSLMRWVSGVVSTMAVAAMCTTFAKMYTDISLVNGADYGALVLRAGLLGVLLIMLLESRPQEGKQ